MRSRFVVRRAAPIAIAFLAAARALAQEPPAPAEPTPAADAPPTAAVAPAAPAIDPELFRQLEERLRWLEERERVRATTAVPAPSASGVQLGASFRDAFFLEAPDGAFKLRMGGLVQADGRYFPGNTNPAIFSNFVLRSVRPEIEGTLFRYVDFKLTPDFGQGKVQVQDAYVELRLAAPLRLRGGKGKVPFGLERLVPEGRTAFLERAFPTQLSPNRDIGVMVSGDVAGGILQYGVGAFNGVVDNSTLDLETDDDKEVAGRIFLHPFRGTQLAALRDLGVGAAASYGDVRGSVTTPSLDSYQTDGLNVFFKYAAGTSADDTTLAAGSRIRAAVHGYWYVWRLALFGEYVWNSQEIRHAAVRAAVPVQAWQGYVTFLLTDDRSSFTGVRPRRPFSLTPGERSPGAFELAFRVSGISVDDVAFNDKFADPTKSARSATSYAVGLNWYLSANTKLQLNYVRTDFVGGAAGSANRPSEDVLQGRLQFSL
jgi:phosphate-selective porin OprO/OprP